MSVFLRSEEEYVREVNVIEGYLEQLTLYLSLMTDMPEATVKEWVKKEFDEGGEFAINTPMANIAVRDKVTGDRRRARISMGKLFQVLDKQNLIVSPAMTFYVPATVKRSLLSTFIDQNVQKRGKVKKEMLAALAAGDHLLASNKKNAQNSFKQRNNAMSGAHSSPFTILYNKSTHSSLTSLCRSATSYGNSNNEKLTASSRHYWAAGIVVNNILSTIKKTNFEEFKLCMETCGLVYPTVEDTMSCIKRSSEPYWRNEVAMNEIRTLVTKLTDLQRAAFVYIGDLYQVRKLNDAYVRRFITEILDMSNVDDVDVSDVEQKLDGDTLALISLLRRDIVTGNVTNTKAKFPDKYQELLRCCGHIFNTLKNYDLFIKAVMTTANVPASIAKIPEVIRRVSLVSDTDSTMITVMRWSEWYCGKGITTGKKADDVADLMIYIATQNIAHMMARMSTNIGVEKSNIHRYSMKNEFKFSSFALTNKAKHYFSLITSQEGTVFNEPELEMKGVALRSSNIPSIVMDEYRVKVTEMLDDVMNGRNIKLLPLLRHIANIEHRIERSIYDSEYTYLKTGNIKPAESYSKPEESNYRYHEFWKEVWAPKYGEIAEPPYNVVKFSVSLTTKTEVKRWIDNIADKALADRLRRWMQTRKPNTFIHFLLPDSVVASNGIPKEMLPAANIRRIKFSSVEPYYHVLESLGVVMIEKNRSKLLSDFYGERLVKAEEL